MNSGPLVRSTKKEKNYQRYTSKRTNDCDFCDFTADMEQVVKEYSHFWVVKNMFSYDIWDSLDVIDHLMVVPKRHVDTIGHFTPVEAIEYMELLGAHEQTGYSIYARAPQSIAKSVAHQHTHLIKLGNRKIRGLVYVHKPHIRRVF